MHNFKGWGAVAEQIEILLQSKDETILDEGQRASLRAIQTRLQTGQRALLLADEVGMGKTRIAAALIHAVKTSGGRTAVVLPPNVGKQWLSEIQVFDQADKSLVPLRSYEGFIQAYAPEQSGRTSKLKEKRRQEHRIKARQMRALPEGEWSDEATLLISHNFANMQFPLKEAGHSWRRELLPAISKFRAGGQKHIRKNVANSVLSEATHHIAKVIAQHENLPELPNCDWRSLPAREYRKLLLPFVGRALGQFDLVIVDEAHKARGQDSSLSRILGPVTWVQPDGFRMGMTATPVELDASQWINTLERILGRDDATCDAERAELKAELSKLESPIQAYSDIVKRMKSEPLDEAVVADFETAARDFQTALSPYVIRRDKRSDKELAQFKCEHGDYREIKPITVDPADPSQCDAAWLRRFCAAEALSMLPEAGRSGKLARLKLDKGLLFAGDLSEASDDKPNERFWLSKVQTNPEDIYWHPAIVQTVEKIEALSDDGHKTLVFATLTKPIRALNQLLDARAMLKALDQGDHWPASKVRTGSEAVTLAAMEQLNWEGGKDLEAVNARLEVQYRAAHSRRSDQLDKIFESLTKGDPSTDILLHFWNRSVAGQRNRISEIIDAMRLICDVDKALQSPQSFMTAFTDLLDTLKTAEETEDEEPLPDALIPRLEAHLEAFSSRESNFSRVMDGNTDPLTRHTLQEAFNRQYTWPMVLITQSVVGREGLNLHKACRHVVLHAEWNPGTLEQQIGRVDRKGSKWVQDCAATFNGPDEVPKIEIYTVSVFGSYDQHQWDVANERWRALRAQLHGEVIPAVDSFADSDFLERIRKNAPSFFPK